MDGTGNLLVWGEVCDTHVVVGQAFLCASFLLECQGKTSCTQVVWS
jgi:hypothetical protein